MLSVNICACAGYSLVLYVFRTPKLDNHAKVLWSALKSDGIVPIRTSKYVGDEITPSVTSCHKDNKLSRWERQAVRTIEL